MGEVKEVPETAAGLKEAGNKAYQQGNYEEALALYTRAINLCGEDETREKSTYYKNRAAVHLKQENYQDVVADCSLSLELTPNDAKALYRRCLAHKALGIIKR